MKNPINNTTFYKADLESYVEFLNEELVDAYNELYEDSDLKIETHISEINITDENSDFCRVNEAEIEHYKEVSSFLEEFSRHTDSDEIICEDYKIDFIDDLMGDNIPEWAVIEYDKTWDNLMVDYTSVEFDGKDYFIRD